MIDWGQGRYERTAEQLLPAARHVVGLQDARPVPGRPPRPAVERHEPGAAVAAPGSTRRRGGASGYFVTRNWPATVPLLPTRKRTA